MSKAKNLGAGSSFAQARPISARRAPEEGITVFASRHYAGDPRLAELRGQALAHLGLDASW